MTGRMIVKLGSLLLAAAYLDPGNLLAQVASQVPPAMPPDHDASIMTFHDLERIDGRRASMSDYKQEYLVVCFTSNTCPYSVDYEERLKQLQVTLRKNNWSAIVLAINSNDHKDDTLEEMAERAKQQKFNFDYLKDVDQSVARAFDAVYTPEFFVLNQNRRIVYQGAMDDSTNPKAATINYVLKAVESLRKGGTIEVAKTGARGCRIRFQRRRKKP